MNMKLTQGAHELILAMSTWSPKGYRGIPALVWGSPGKGKSTFVESLHRTDVPVVTMIASLHDPTDFNGLPVVQGDRVRFVPPDWVYQFEETGKGILFLDELTTAPPTVQAALLRLVLERKVGAHALPPGVCVVAAANPPDMAASGWELSPPLANRFVHIDWDLPGQVYSDALLEGFTTPELQDFDRNLFEETCFKWKAIVAGFLKRQPASVVSEPADGEYAFATPRSWDYAIALMTTCDLNDLAPGQAGKSIANAVPFKNLVKGCLGSGVSTSFLSFLHEFSLPDPMEVLEGKADIAVSMREDGTMVLFNAMANILQNNKSRNEPNLVPRTERFLDLAIKLANANKADPLYTTLRSLVKTNFLAEVAKKSASIKQKVSDLGRYYKDLVEVLES